MNTEFKLGTSFQRKVGSEFTWNSRWISPATGSLTENPVTNIDNNVLNGSNVGKILYINVQLTPQQLKPLETRTSC